MSNVAVGVVACPKLPANNFERNNNALNRALNFDIISATLLKVKCAFCDAFNESESDLLW